MNNILKIFSTVNTIAVCHIILGFFIGLFEIQYESVISDACSATASTFAFFSILVGAGLFFTNRLAGTVIANTEE